MRPRRLALAAAASLILGALSAAAAPPPTGPDADRAVAPGRESRAEPSVAVHPRDPRTVLVAALHYRTQYQTGFGRLSAPDVALFLSRDGGRTFRQTGIVPRPPKTSYTADPSVAFDSRGRAYVGYLASAPNTEAGLFVVRSDDGGETWPKTATRVARETVTEDSCFGHDKPYLTVGPAPRRAPRGTERDWVYISWHINAYSDAECAQIDAEASRAMFARSTDGGRTFSPPVELNDRKSWAATPAVAPDGTLHVAHLVPGGTMSCPQSWPETVVVATSRDGGASFTYTDAMEICYVLPGTPTGGIYYANSLPTIAVNPRTGAAVVASVHRDGAADVVLVAGSDGRGGRWERRTPIPRPLEVIQELPWLAYSPSGRLAAVFLGQLPGGLYDAYLAWSRDDGRTWSVPTKLTSLPSVGNLRSFADQWSLGHYLGLAVGRDEVAHPVWPDIRPGEASMVNIWTRPVPLGSST